MYQPVMFRFMQINLNHCWAAQQLLTQTILERSVDIVLISDQIHNPVDDDRWSGSRDSECAIAIGRSSLLIPERKGAGKGFAWMVTGGMNVVSCYCPPRWSEDEYDRFFEELLETIHTHLMGGVLIVGGDFNAHSPEWGAAYEDQRGRKLSDFAASLGMVTANLGSTPTYNRVNAQSVVDVTFIRITNGVTVKDWRVLSELNSESDHDYIQYLVGVPGGAADGRTPGPVQMSGWAVRKVDRQKLAGALRREPSIPETATPEEMAGQVQEYLRGLCEASMPRRVAIESKRSVHWWTDEIASLRKDSIAARRRYQRAGRRSGAADRSEKLAESRAAAKKLRVAIRASQEKCWRRLCDDVDNDPWGTPYRVAMRKLGRKSPGLAACGREIEVARELFPPLPPAKWDDFPVEDMSEEDLSAEGAALFTRDEVLRAAARLPNGKAPGPDGIPNEILVAAVNKHPDIFVTVFNRCWKAGVFPTCWKIAKLVLLHKGQGKPLDEASSFRPLSLLNGAGKLFERVILKRIYKWLESEGGLNPRQFGFRPGRSTVDAVRAVLDIAESAAKGAVQDRHLCAVVALDVKNAFNSAPWVLIDAALHRKAAPKRLRLLLRSYMADRMLTIESGGRETTLEVTGGVPQGSVIGPILWNVFYDGLMELEVPDDAHIVAFADDVAVVTIGHNKELLEEVTNASLNMVNQWMSDNGLQVAPQKSEAVILTRKWAYADPEIIYGGHPIDVGRSIKYLGVLLDTRMSFKEHLSKVSASAKRSAVALGRLMPNVGGPSQVKRRLLMSVVHSKLLYAAPVWAHSACSTARNRDILTQVQRLAALRVTRCYRTVSDVAALVLAGMPPAHLLADERARVKRRISAVDGRPNKDMIATAERLETMERWQVLWVETSKGAWTRRLLPDVRRWCWRITNTEVTYHLAQALTGHGCFRSYLFKRKRAGDEKCIYCGAPEDTAEHTIFVCKQWEGERSEIIDELGRNVSPDDVEEILCGPDPGQLPRDPLQAKPILLRARRVAEALSSMIKAIISKKEEDERRLKLQLVG